MERVFIHDAFTTLTPALIFPVPTGEMSLEATDDVDAIQEDVWERSPPNKQLAFLVYCQGEQINLFGIIDRGDGMLTPVPELLRFVVTSCVAHVLSS